MSQITFLSPSASGFLFLLPELYTVFQADDGGKCVLSDRRPENKFQAIKIFEKPQIIEQIEQK